MATEVKLPKLGFSMEDGVLIEWFIEDGAEVSKGELLYALEAEKAVQEIEAPDTGTLKILVQPSDDELKVGTVLGKIE